MAQIYSFLKWLETYKIFRHVFTDGSQQAVWERRPSQVFPASCQPDCSGPVHGEAARCHEVDRVEYSGRPVLQEFTEL